MRAAVHRVDRVREGENIFGIAVVVLNRDFHVHLLALAFHVDGRVVQDAFAAIQVLDEFGDAAGESELGFFIRALVLERDFQALVQESQFAQALRKRVVAVGDSVEDRRIGVEGDLRAGFFRFAGSLQLRCGHALLVRLFPDFAFAPDLQVQPVGKRVDHRNADAVQAAGNFVGIAIEFSAGVQHGHHNFGCGLFFCRVHVHGNAAAVVNHGDAVVVMHQHVDLVAVAGHRFVHGVVGNFPDEMMQSHFTGRADVHRGAFADGFDAAENFDRGRVVLVPGDLGGRSLFVSHESCVSPQMASDTWRSCDSRVVLGKAVARNVPDIALPIGPSRSKNFCRAGTRRVFQGSIPSRSEFFGRTRRSLFSPRRMGSRSLATRRF